MGIEFIVESQTNDEWNSLQEKTLSKYCKYAWRNIEWQDIFSLINFQINCLYGNSTNYWETSHLNDILKKLKMLKNKDPYFINDYDDETQTEENDKIVDVLMSDIEQLIKLFEEYVEMNCRIIVY